MLGCIVGAVVGAVGRFFVAVLFLYYVLNWGGPFFREQAGVSLADLLFTLHARWPLFLISAGIGLFAGGTGGATCKPMRGAVIGGGLSGLFCVGMFVLPASVAIGMSGGGVVDYAPDQSAIAVGLFAMILVGAAAGGMGAAIGKFRRQIV